MNAHDQARQTEKAGRAVQMTDWQWFALRVEPGRELAAEARLREAEHFTFVPLKHVPRKRARRGKKLYAARARYPGYLFIGQPPGFELPWLRILDDELFPGVHGVIGHGGAPIAVREESMTPMIIDQLLMSSRLSGQLRLAKGGKRGKKKITGDIVTGPYQDKAVRVIEVPGDDPELYELFQVAA